MNNSDLFNILKLIDDFIKNKNTMPVKFNNNDLKNLYEKLQEYNSVLNKKINFSPYKGTKDLSVFNFGSYINQSGFSNNQCYGSVLFIPYDIKIYKIGLYNVVPNPTLNIKFNLYNYDIELRNGTKLFSDIILNGNVGGLLFYNLPSPHILSKGYYVFAMTPNQTFTTYYTQNNIYHEIKNDGSIVNRLNLNFTFTNNLPSIIQLNSFHSSGFQPVLYFENEIL